MTVKIISNKTKDLHDKIYNILAQELKTNEMSYQKFSNANGRPYQSYERIDFEGLRWSVEKRIMEYGLKRFFNPESLTLDIGSNYGFFTNEFGFHCKEAHGIEPIAELNEIGQITAEFLGISKKVKFFTETFEEFESSNKYDLITSLASFFTSDTKQRSTANSYFGKIYNLIKTGGWLFYESTSYQKNPQDEDFAHYAPSLEALTFIKDNFVDVEYWESPSGPENLRLYIVARKQ
tara:strand:+ start:691 stop:1395 length:705 start_codon:yes stop_codon:yes gene_type:complete